MKLVPYSGIEDCKAKVKQHLSLGKLPYSLIIQSDFGNGKSGCLDYVSKFIEETYKKRKYPCLPAIKIVMPPAPSEARIYNAILEQLNIPFTNKEPNDNKLKQIKLIMGNLSTRSLAIDDVDMLSCCTQSQIEQTLFGIIQLAHHLNLVLMMSVSSFFNLDLISSHTRKLKSEVINLPKWSAGVELKEFVEQFLQVKKRIDEKFLVQLISDSKGNLDNIVQILNYLKAEHGSGDDCVTYDALKNLHWNSHTKRLSGDLW